MRKILHVFGLLGIHADKVGENTGNHTEKILRVRNTRIVASDPDFRCSAGEFGVCETVFFLTTNRERGHIRVSAATGPGEPFRHTKRSV